MRILKWFFIAVFFFGWCLGASSSSARAESLDIRVVFEEGLTPSQRAIFTQAESLWESVILGYQPGISRSRLLVYAEGAEIDGVGGILAQAGPNGVAIEGGYFLATSGSMTFDIADLANMESNGTLLNVITHEMAHVLGFGTFWNLNHVYSNNTGRYTGAAALAAYRAEFNQPDATYIPVELGGGEGTANSHWNEVDGGSGLTGIVDSLGRDMRNELMTGWLNAPCFLSQTTIQSFADIGFIVVPEPGTLAMLIGAAFLAIAVFWRII